MKDETPGTEKDVNFFFEMTDLHEHMEDEPVALKGCVSNALPTRGLVSTTLT